MPIIDIEIVVAPGRAPSAGVAQSLADALGSALGSPPGQTWVRVRTLPREDYAENRSMVQLTELPVFVKVLERVVPAAAELTQRVSAITAAVAGVLQCSPACVHVEYAPGARGRMAFGGRIVE